MSIRRTFSVAVVAFGLLASTSAMAQNNQPGQPIPPMTFASLSDATVQDDEDDEALAKTLNDFHARLQALESGASAISDGKTVIENKEAIDKNIGAIDELDSALDGKAASGHSGSTMKVSGRVHLDYWSFPDVHPGLFPLENNGEPIDRFGFRRLRFGVNGKVRDNMGYKIEVEFANPGSLEYRDAYLTFNNLPCNQTVIIGNHKRPYGLDHLNSSRYNVFMERPYIIEAFNQDARRLGISTNGYSDNLCHNWRVGIFEQQKTQGTFGYVGNHYQLEAVGRYGRTWWYDECSGGRGYGHVGFAGGYGDADGLGANNQARWDTRPEARTSNDWLDTGQILGADDYYIAAFEFVFNAGPAQFVAEYQYRNVDRLGAFGNNVELHGGYIYASYFLTGEHIPWNRQTGTIGRIQPFENFFCVCDCDGYKQMGKGAWQVAARLSHADLTDENIIGGVGTSMTLGLNWYWNAYARMQFNYIYGDIDRQAIASGDYQVFGTRFMIDF